MYCIVNQICYYFLIFFFKSNVFIFFILDKAIEMCPVTIHIVAAVGGETIFSIWLNEKGLLCCKYWLMNMKINLKISVKYLFQNT